MGAEFLAEDCLELGSLRARLSCAPKSLGALAVVRGKSMSWPGDVHRVDKMGDAVGVMFVERGIHCPSTKSIFQGGNP